MNLKGKYAFHAFTNLLFLLYHIRALLVKLVKTFLAFHGTGRVANVLTIRPNVTVRHPQLSETDPQIHTLFLYVYPPIHTYASKRVTFNQFPTRILYPYLT